MEKKTMLLWGFVGLTTFWSVAKLFMGSVDGSAGGMILERQLQTSFASATVGIECGYSEENSEYFLPTEATQNYLSILDADVTEMSELKNELGAIQPKPLVHTIGEPVEAWSIVLQPNNETGKVRILAIGKDLTTPKMETTLDCDSNK